MSFDPYAPYGPVVDTTLRVVTWNVWGRFGEWEQRQEGIEAALEAAQPDVVCLVEAWQNRDGPDNQAERVARRLGFEHHQFAGGWEVDDWTSGLAVVSRWPILSSGDRDLPNRDGTGNAGSALFTAIDGPRGTIQLFTIVLDYPLDGSATRQTQVHGLAKFIGEVTSGRYPTIVCGDFNANPDSDEIRMLTGKSETASPGLVFYDAWEIAGDGTPGITWSNNNPLAAIGLYPDRRFDYVLSAWPRLNGVGHPVQAKLLGLTKKPTDLQLSDHYGVVADLRY
jgi:endonuclease/exonuclease/phosphatase family metal-dependent hydrolase